MLFLIRIFYPLNNFCFVFYNCSGDSVELDLNPTDVNGRIVFEHGDSLNKICYDKQTTQEISNQFTAYSVEYEENQVVGDYTWEVAFWRDVNGDNRIESEYDKLLKNPENFDNLLPTFSGDFRIVSKSTSTEEIKPKFEIINPLEGGYLGNVIGIFWKPGKDNDNNQYSLEYAIENQAYDNNAKEMINTIFFNFSMSNYLDEDDETKITFRIKQESSIKTTINVIGSKSQPSNVRIIGTSDLKNELTDVFKRNEDDEDSQEGSSGAVGVGEDCEESGGSGEGKCQENPCGEGKLELTPNDCEEGLVCCQDSTI